MYTSYGGVKVKIMMNGKGDDDANFGGRHWACGADAM